MYMRYIIIILNSIILYFKSLIKKGSWKIKYWDNISPSIKIRTNVRSIIELKGHIIFEKRGSIFIGKNAKLSIGNATYFNEGIIISCQNMISIGSNCLFGPDVKIYDNNHKFAKDRGVSTDLSVGTVEIGNNCWIASNVVILKDTKIGDNCVIGAGCVVSGNIPSNSILKQDKKNYIIEKIR